MVYSFFCYDFNIGRITVADDGAAVTHLLFNHSELPEHFGMNETPLTAQAAGEIGEYLAGVRTGFTLRIAPVGTPFRMSVWRALMTIPYGETRSYKDIARQIGNPAACRAVGMANNRNPISIVVPCHRVIGSDGSLVGYGGGIGIKKQLLELEARCSRLNPTDAL